MKPLFPLSVERSFHYRAVIKDTGEILESDNFKSLYHATKSHLRIEVGAVGSDHYNYSTAVLSFGYSTVYESKPGYYYGEWEELQTLGCFLFLLLLNLL